MIKKNSFILCINVITAFKKVLISMAGLNNNSFLFSSKMTDLDSLCQPFHRIFLAILAILLCVSLFQ